MCGVGVQVDSIVAARASTLLHGALPGYIAFHL